jgi:UDP-N-acetylmuramoyl-tripeptide--D-alanyl-D-alanine ligase
MTPLWSAHDLQQATGGTFTRGFDATGVSIDTRTLAPGDLFVALVGEHGDGHDHVAAAFAAGAAGAMVHRPVNNGDAAMLVDDTQAGLMRLGAFARARFGGRMVAVTGSVGKTTTKEMLRAGLSAQGDTHAAVASYNNQWGVPLTLSRLPPTAAFCVAEIGMNHPDEIEPLARIVQPHVALITAIERVHIGNMGSLEAIADEKAGVLRALLPGGVAVLPADSAMLPRLKQALPADARAMTFGTGPEADAQLLEATSDADGTSLRARVGGTTVTLRIAAPGRHMAIDAVAALAAVAAIGADPTAGARALAGFAPLSGRGARRPIGVSGGTALLIDESYNASSPSVRAALMVLALQQASRRVAVLGDMLELGDASDSEHRDLAPFVAAGADILYACGPARVVRRRARAVAWRARDGFRRTGADRARGVAPGRHGAGQGQPWQSHA